MTKKKHGLPETVHVYEEVDGKEKYLVAARTPFDAAERYEQRIVGVYRLVRVERVEMIATVKAF